MKKWMMVFAALLPFASQATTLNSTNDPNRPGYNPSQQRMQSQMQTQQQQQQLKLRQDQQRQTQDMQRKMQEQRDSARQRVIDTQPGNQTQTQSPNQN
ncbi:DUF2756 domain-containing protein [Pantoea sp. NSTU24]|uniref:DUF2756 domain-containing protein n=1 Tax=Pantoea sp. NSTU24 TaxID=3391144 RepID=UPI003D08E827